ncbi:MAG: phosphatase PAP2 family protein [Clostridiales bacterium]|nr:phosphatase PAP2 family protein [Clostridiales bacterium]
MKIKEWIKNHKALWALVLPLYLASFFAVERVVTEESAWTSTILPIDDFIPFFEWAIFAYMLWFPLLVVTGLYLLFTNGKAFRRYMLFMAIGFMASVVICLVFPNGTGLDFRPDLETLGRSNIATFLCSAIYSADTCTNVIPSIHVVGAIMVLGGFYDSNLSGKKWLAALEWILNVLVIVSTVLVKQHAFIDVVAGLVLGIVDYIIVYVIVKRKDKQKE